jgi:hypothetical protein
MTRILLTAMLALGLGVSAMAEEGKPAVRLTADKWCATHDLPKDKCVTCDKKLIPQLKKDKDWCAEHNCAESICIPCDPKAKARLDAMRPEAAAAK